MVSFLKKASQLGPKYVSPRFLLHTFLTRPKPGRSTKVMHASDLTTEAGFCPRYPALCDAAGTTPDDEWLSTSEASTFQMGRDLQDRIVHWFADMGRAVGDWRCDGCDKLFQFQARPPKCSHCGCRSFAPEEVRFQSAENGTSCGIDMLLNLDGPKLTVIEIKTIDKDEFKALKAPLAEHRLRTNLYLRLIAESAHAKKKLVRTDRAYVLYASKGGYGCLDKEVQGWPTHEQFSPYKEFEIKRDDSQTDDLVAPAKIVYDYRQGLIGMPAGVCHSALDKRAAKCPRRAECFSGKYPPEHHWEK